MTIPKSPLGFAFSGCAASFSAGSSSTSSSSTSTSTSTSTSSSSSSSDRAAAVWDARLALYANCYQLIPLGLLDQVVDRCLSGSQLDLARPGGSEFAGWMTEDVLKAVDTYAREAHGSGIESVRLPALDDLRASVYALGCLKDLHLLALQLTPANQEVDVCALQIATLEVSGSVEDNVTILKAGTCTCEFAFAHHEAGRFRIITSDDSPQPAGCDDFRILEDSAFDAVPDTWEPPTSPGFDAKRGISSGSEDHSADMLDIRCEQFHAAVSKDLPRADLAGQAALADRLLDIVMPGTYTLDLRKLDGKELESASRLSATSWDALNQVVRLQGSGLETVHLPVPRGIEPLTGGPLSGLGDLRIVEVHAPGEGPAAALDLAGLYQDNHRLQVNIHAMPPDSSMMIPANASVALAVDVPAIRTTIMKPVPFTGAMLPVGRRLLAGQTGGLPDRKGIQTTEERLPARVDVATPVRKRKQPAG